MTLAAGQQQIPLIGNGSGAPIEEWNAWTYRVNSVSDTTIPTLIRKVLANTKAKCVTNVFDQTQEIQAADANICRTQASAQGYEIVADQAFKTGDQNFSPQIARIGAARPDVVFRAVIPDDGAKVVPQLRDVGINMSFMTGFGAFQDPTYRDASGGAINGCHTSIAQDLARGDEGLRACLDRYNKTFPQPANTNSAFGYDSVDALAACAASSDQPSRTSVQAALSHLSTEAPTGTAIRFENPPHGSNQDPTETVVRVTSRPGYDVI